MKFSKYLPGPRRARWLVACAGALGALLSAGLVLSFVSDAAATATAVQLGNATSFGVLAGSGITNTGATTVNGDIGTYPTLSITGAGTMIINGTTTRATK